MAKYVQHPYESNHITMNEGLPEQKRTAGDAIRLYRELRGISRKELADLVSSYSEMFHTKFTYQDIYGYEELRITPKMDKMTALCKATGFPLAFFCGYKDAVIKRYVNGRAA